MTLKRWLLGSAGMMALTVLAGDAQSAPLQIMASDFKRGAVVSPVESVQYRLCVTEAGGRQCRAVEIYGPGRAGYPASGPQVYGYQAIGQGTYGYQAPINGAYPSMNYGYAPAGGYIEGYTERYVNPDLYPTGSQPWWESMDKLGRGGQRY
jgi:hypothetical protein